MLFAWCQTCQKVPDHWRWYAEPSRRATTIRVRCHGAEQEVSIAQEVLEDLRPIPEAIAVFDEWGRPHWRFLFEEDITLALSLSRLEWAAVTFRNALAEGAVSGDQGEVGLPVVGLDADTTLQLAHRFRPTLLL